MACFVQHGDDAKITIPRVEERDKCTFYDIFVQVGEYKWSVTHRYSDFVQLHDILVSEHGVAKDILPPKKLIGNKEPSFIEKRRMGLEIYLATIVRYLQKAMPRKLAIFLNFHEYDILFLLQTMAAQFFQLGESMLMRSRNHVFTPLQLYAISERLKQPCPNTEHQNQQHDFSHVLDYCSQITELIINGSDDAVKTSNIIPNQLPFNLSSFKSVKKLSMNNVNFDKITDLGSVKMTAKHFEIHNTNMETISEILLCDQMHKTVTNSNTWTTMTTADFSFNKLNMIDESIQLLPELQVLNLENNNIQEIQFLNHLTKLKYINLSTNLFKNIENVELKLCKIVYLDLSQNLLTSLKWFYKLFSLETLDVKSNQISEVSEVKHIASLPCLENLVLTGNPVSTVIDYRVRVLELFGTRALEICLDNEKSNQKELDKVAILQAIRLSNEGCTKKKMSGS